MLYGRRFLALVRVRERCDIFFCLYSGRVQATQEVKSFVYYLVHISIENLSYLKVAFSLCKNHICCISVVYDKKKKYIINLYDT